jgi:hypothetical protein
MQKIAHAEDCNSAGLGSAVSFKIRRARSRSQVFRSPLGLHYCFRIHVDILWSATGDMVSSISAYSAGAPVLAVCNK